MAIEFYKIEDRKQESILLQIPEEQFIAFEQVFVEFQKLTGMLIDPYGTTRVYSSHLVLLNKLLAEANEFHSLRVSPTVITAFHKLLKSMIQNEQGLLIVGE